MGAVLVLTALLTLLYAGSARAETFVATNTANGGIGSLREAITKANARAGADQVVFADGVSGTIALASTLPRITDPEGLLIDGGGDVTVSGNDIVGVFWGVGRIGAGAQEPDRHGGRRLPVRRKPR